MTELEIETNELVFHGRRCSALREYAEAADYFQQALEGVVAAEGELCEKSAPLYYYYGSAIFQAESSSTSGTDVFGKDLEPSEHKEQIAPEDKSIVGDYPSSEDSSQGEKSESKDDAPVTSVQIAWEALECARVIYERLLESNKDSRYFQLALSQVFEQLAQLSMENESFAQSESDFEKALNFIGVFPLISSSRYLAQLHYNLGLTKQYQKDYEGALKQVQNAIQVIESRIKNNGAVVSNYLENDEEYMRLKHVVLVHVLETEIDDNIEELKSLLNEMQNKRAELELETTAEAKQQVREAQNELAAALSTEPGFTVPDSVKNGTAGAVNTLPVRKKAKTSEGHNEKDITKPAL